MIRSLFQKPRGTGFQGRYDAFEDDGDSFRRRHSDFDQRATPQRMPLLLRMIVLLLAAVVGVVIGFLIWLFAEVLMLPH